MTIYVDMDEVLTDFANAASLVHGKDHLVVDHSAPYVRNPDARWDLKDRFGMEHDEFWGPINAIGHTFWADLEPLPWAFDLWEAINARYDDVIVCTSPAHHPSASSGKVAWFQRHFAADFRNYILCPSELKCRLAHPDCVLIDDRPSNISEFNQSLGHGILFPMPWNSAEPVDADRKVDFIMTQLDTFDSVSKHVDPWKGGV